MKSRILFLIIVFAFTSCIKCKSESFTGVYWGAFDPPTEAHVAIIKKSLTALPLKKLIVVVNNHPYKTYTFPLEIRMEKMKMILQQEGLEQVELLWQDEAHPLDFTALKKLTQGALCAIAGYDAYKKWVTYSSSSERACYDAIAVIPRGDEIPLLFDDAAFLLPIDSKYKDVSSTKIKAFF